MLVFAPDECQEQEDEGFPVIWCLAMMHCSGAPTPPAAATDLPEGLQREMPQSESTANDTQEAVVSVPESADLSDLQRQLEELMK